MKTTVTTRANIFWLLLAAMLNFGAAGAADGSTNTAKTAIPKIAAIGDLQIGYSTQEELARHWGVGLECTGGHPNSGRQWRVRNTDWIIATDGFQYSSRGLVIDAFELRLRSKAELVTNVPFAKLDPQAFAWLGKISPGMTKPEVLAALKQQRLQYQSHSSEVTVRAKGYSEITSELHASFHAWQATLIFAGNNLSGLRLSASP